MYKYDEFNDLDDLEFDENLDFNEEDIYNELENIDNLMLENEMGFCVECGSLKGHLHIDPYSNDGTMSIYLCENCAQDSYTNIIFTKVEF